MRASRLFMVFLLTICLPTGHALGGHAPGGVAQEKTPLSNSPMINCVVKSLRKIKISVPISGVVSQVKVKSGSTVQKGDVLVLLDSDLARADLALAEQKASFKTLLHAAQLQENVLMKRVERLQTALSRQSISVDEFEEAQQQYELSKTNVAREKQALALAKKEAERARVLVEKTIIRSPADGVIGEDLVNPSEAIGEKPVATLYVTKTLRAEAFIPIPLSDYLRENKPYKLIINDQAIPISAVKIDYFSPTVNLSSNTISVFFTIDSDGILPGHSCLLNLQSYGQSS